MRPVMKMIGEEMTESTKRRFETSIGPDGKRWKALARSTVLARLSKVKGAYKKTGKISKKGSTSAASMRPLIDTRELSTTLRYQIASGGAAVEIGTNRTFNEGKGVGAEVHQFGTRDGRIPARPFLGLSNSDKTTLLDSLASFLKEQVKP
jgi:phage gpG-like protein